MRKKEKTQSYISFSYNVINHASSRIPLAQIFPSDLFIDNFTIFEISITFFIILKFFYVYEKLNNTVEQAIIVNTYGVLYYKQGEYEKAFLEYQRAMKLNPEDPNPYYNLACVSSITNKPDIALGYLNKTIKLNPTYKEMISKEKDLDNLRNLEEFKNLIS